MKSFIDLSAKDIFPNLPDTRQESGLITTKQIRYIFVLAKQYDIPKEDLDKIEWRHFNSEEATQLIEDIKSHNFYNKYIRNDSEAILERINQISDDEMPFF